MWTLNIADVFSFKNHTLIMLDPCSWCTCGLTWLIGIGMLAPGNLICHFSTGILREAREIIQDFLSFVLTQGSLAFPLAFLGRFSDFSSKNACIPSEVLLSVHLFFSYSEWTHDMHMTGEGRKSKEKCMSRLFFLKQDTMCAVSNCNIQCDILRLCWLLY